MNIEQTINLSEEELYKELGRISKQYVENSKLGIRPPTKSQIIKWGKSIFNDHIPKLKDLLCSNEKLRNFSINNSNKLDYALLIMSLIQGKIGETSRIPIITVLIVMKGVNFLCDE
ncbi:hypothetical protein Q4Q35_13780 [Flavivirga aquimarina]|uniref:Uncharacterized protein n=1 Tax=Flavivirga aquimarina TaxID=2027862 RepID=A0ABT8WCM0_9FLAO|nr:hypothetical protein [Flavivirga aquimarina]MDO5970878.1 hypothetical protein [Flavivirga aquimarina]